MQLKRQTTQDLLGTGDLDDKVVAQIDMLRLGATFRKRNKFLGTAQRYFWVPNTMDRLCWGQKNRSGQMSMSGFLYVVDVERVIGNEKKILIRTNKRELEISCKDSKQLHDWEHALRGLTKFVRKDYRAMELRSQGQGAYVNRGSIVYVNKGR